MEKYEKLEIEVIHFDNEDVITDSQTGGPEYPANDPTQGG